MAKFRIEAPDGKVFDVEGPEGSTAEQALAQVQASYKPKDASAEQAPDPTGSFGQNLAAGMGRAVNRAGLGIKQMGAQVMDKIAPKEATLSDLVSKRDPSRSAAVQSEIDETASLDASLMKTTGGKVGDIFGNVAMAIPTVVVPGANTYTGAATIGSLMGLTQPTQGDESRLANTTIGGVSGIAGKAIGDKVAGAISGTLANRTAKATQSQSQNAVRDAALAAGREAGAVVPPHMVQKQGAFASVLEGFGGKFKTAQQASNRNQGVWNELGRKALGISDDTPITPEVLQAIRADAGKAYEALRGIGNISPDRQFGAELARITQKYQGAAKDFPDLAKNEIGDIVASVNKSNFSADSAIDAISILRDKAGASFAKGEKAAGSAYRQTAQAMEDAIERHLLQSGSTDAVSAFQAARKLIAKTYSIEGALEGGGNVSAQKLASQLKKGKPLTDELRVIADFAANFPKAAQNIAKVEPTSILDTAAVGGLAALGAGPASLIPLARPAARSVVLSDMFQNMTTAPKYGVSGGLKVADLLAKNPALRAGLPGAAAGASLSYSP